jgi:hypothetical protein
VPLSDILLAPFLNIFCPPLIETPFSTLSVPTVHLTLPACLISFFLIVSGVVYCSVTEAPWIGYIPTENDEPSISWIAVGDVETQFLTEGLVAGIFLSFGALSLIALFYEASKVDLRKRSRVLRSCGMSAPFWIFATFVIFRLKVPAYLPSFTYQQWKSANYG